MSEAKRRLIEEYNKGFDILMEKLSQRPTYVLTIDEALDLFNAEEDISHLVDITCSWQEEKLGVGYTEDDLNDHEKELLRFSKEWLEAHGKE